MTKFIQMGSAIVNVDGIDRISFVPGAAWIWQKGYDQPYQILLDQSEREVLHQQLLEYGADSDGK